MTKEMIPDIDGCHNVPDGWVNPDIKVREHASEDLVQRIIYNDVPDELPHRSDNIMVGFTPEELHIVKHIIKRFSTDGSRISYLEDELGIDDIYDQQTYIRDNFVQKIESALDEYIANRPYTPFFSSFVKKIKKENVRGDVDKLQVFRS